MVRKRFLLTAAALVFFSIPNLFAQEGDEDYEKPSLDRIANYLTYSNYNDLQSLNRNECLSFLNDTTGRSNIKFKSVTETKYSSSDSLIEHKKLQSKTVYRYNTHGQIISYIVTDTIGKVKDSAIIFYDPQFHSTQARGYSFNDVTKELAISYKLNNAYDTKGNLIKMESREYKKSYDELNPGGYDTSNITTYATYNNNGKPTQSLIVLNIQDTTLIYYFYDTKGKFSSLKGIHHVHKDKELFENPKQAYINEAYYVKMDENGNILQTVLISGKDTDKNMICTYDDQSRETSYSEFSKGKLVSKRTILYGQENARTKIEDEYGTSGGSYDDEEGDDDEDESTASPTCTTDTKTVSIYNRYGKLESKTTTITGTGKPSVTIVKHNYVFTNYDKVESDSMTEEEQSEYHSSGTLTVYNYRYDFRGNKLEETEKGGSGTASDNRTTYTWNEKNNLLVESEYGSCLDVPFSTFSYTYYPDGITEKEYDIIRNKTLYVYKFGPETQKLESIYSSSYGVDQTIYEYENW